MKRLFAVISAALLLCSCSGMDTSSQTIEDIMSEANEINQTDDDEYACLPDTVRLDDMYTRELEAQDGDISYDRLGVTFKLPDGYKAYIYEQNDEKRLDDERKAAEKENRKPKEIKTNEPNKTCMAAIFLINGNFPHSHEFVRVGYSTSIFAGYESYSWLENNPDHIPDKKFSKADYKQTLKDDIERLSGVLTAHEGLDAYNYTGLDPAHREWIGGSVFPREDPPRLLFVYNTNNIFRTPADDSSVGEIKCEPVELDSGYIGVKLTYDIKRNGIAMDKEVYWLLDPEAEEDFCFTRRVEFSKDKGAVWLTEPQKFLKDFKITAPDNEQGPTDYFGLYQIEIKE
ncbi:MAG: hypothetical protein K6F91_07690 [Ruminococcus sp.]|nr:hypothetical protein [Ruminococcus sp.]